MKFVSLQKCSDWEQNERAKLESLLHIERGPIQQLHFVPCIAAEWEKLLREVLDAAIEMGYWLWEH